MQDEDDAAPQVVLLPGAIAPCWLQLGPHGEYLGCEAVARAGMNVGAMTDQNNKQFTSCLVSANARACIDAVFDAK